MSGFPQYVVLKCMSNDKYVQCTADGSIRADGNDIWSPHCKFELETAKTDRQKFLNIRSCYTNKYWVAEGPENSCLKAAAAKPDEDVSKWNCTMFCITDPKFEDHYVYSARDSTYLLTQHASFFVGGSSFTFAKFIITDWEFSLVKLPKHVHIMTLSRKYLAAHWTEGHEYHKFNSKDPLDRRTAYEIFPTGDGNVRIKSLYFNKFWRRSPNWIWADSSYEDSNNNDTIFAPVKFGRDSTELLVSLRNLGNNKFCVRLSKEGKEKCLNADESSINPESILRIEEAVLSRDIFNVRYRLMHARIYNEYTLSMDSKVAVNDSSVPKTVTIKLKGTVTNRHIWKGDVFESESVPTTMKARIPMITDDGVIRVLDTITEALKWGETVYSKEIEIKMTLAINVPPRTRVTVSLLGTLATIDVPFSFTQADTIPNQSFQSFYERDDGLCTGFTIYNFRDDRRYTEMIHHPASR